MTDAELSEIRGRTEPATPGPWFVRFLDDDYAANLVAVSMVADSCNEGPPWPDFNGRELVAGTLIQSPIPYVGIEDTKWDENAKFIAHARAHIPRLLDEIRRMHLLIESQGH
jgi:hypothetical protein